MQAHSSIQELDEERARLLNEVRLLREAAQWWERTPLESRALREGASRREDEANTIFALINKLEAGAR